MPTEEIRTQILRGIAMREPRLERAARRGLARLSPDRWTIEWNLPRWLGRAFDLDSSLSEALVRSNVLGLLSIRLEDDLEDGEVPATEVADTRALAALAYAEAVSGYRAWFVEGSPIWPFLERSMAEWRGGAGGAELAARGAPLKFCGFACCLHARRLDAWPTLERSLDEAITALVLYDQIADWEVDLAAGRWNAFVQTIAGGDQEPGRRDRTRSTVLSAILTTDVLRTQFNAAVRKATDAATLAADVGVTDLAEFLTEWATRTSEQGSTIADHYRIAADQATRLIFGTRLRGVA